MQPPRQPFDAVTGCRSTRSLIATSGHRAGAALGMALIVILCGCDSGGTDIKGDARDTVSSPKVASDLEIAFTSSRAGSLDLWLMRPDGSGLVRVTKGQGDEVAPSWSPDGRRLAYLALGDDVTPQIHLVAADGTGDAQLTHGPDGAGPPSWSPDGDKILYSTDLTESPWMFTVAAVGGRPRRITDVAGTWPDWSPDGTNIVYSRVNGTGTRLWTMREDGTHHGRLAGVRASDPSEPSWSPDGEWIAFVSSSGDASDPDPVNWNEDVHLIRVDGTSGTQLTKEPGNDHWPPAWSPDGRRLAITQDGIENSGDIYVVDLGSRRKVNVTRNDADDLMPAWRPRP